MRYSASTDDQFKQLQCMSVVMYSSCQMLEPGPSDF